MIGRCVCCEVTCLLCGGGLDIRAGVKCRPINQSASSVSNQLVFQFNCAAGVKISMLMSFCWACLYRDAIFLNIFCLLCAERFNQLPLYNMLTAVCFVCLWFLLLNEAFLSQQSMYRLYVIVC